MKHGSDFRRIKDSTCEFMPGNPVRSNRRRIQSLPMAVPQIRLMRMSAPIERT